jgi:exodeoxyribonuclease VII large subunit
MKESSPRLSLYQLNHLVHNILEEGLPAEYWVEAELSECRESRGHCYMELIERDQQGATPVARASAKCWASRWQLIRPYFERATGQRLVPGLKVLLKVSAQFHEAYGFSWIVSDIDPTYTLGDQARRRQEIIRQLKDEGVFDLQRELRLPLFCLRIAVISSQTAAGYGDFCNQLADSPFAFRTQLFPAIMQGEGVEQSIIAALERIYNGRWTMNDVPFECVVIIRGGGATSDMSGFDTLALAENVANFPLPIITGIGHDRDECILDMVSHLRVKTPTAAAAFLIERAQEIMNFLNDAQARIVRHTLQRLSTLSAQLNTIHTSLPLLAERRITAERHKISIIEEKLKAADPEILLKRGYSITYSNGKVIRDPNSLKHGDPIETHLEKGTIQSVVI